MDWLWIGGTRPRDMPQWAYSHLVVALKADTSGFGVLKCVEQEGFQNGKPVTLIRIFNAAKADRNRIKEFVSLDQHPELIVYEGHLDRETGAVRIVHGAGWSAWHCAPSTV